MTNEEKDEIVRRVARGQETDAGRRRAVVEALASLLRVDFEESEGGAGFWTLGRYEMKGEGIVKARAEWIPSASALERTKWSGSPEVPPKSTELEVRAISTLIDL